MACPYFMPVARLESGTWPHPARLPLGSGWRGYCTAPGHQGELPQQDTLEAFCNLGYAEACGWSPPQRVWDAVRFAVVAAAADGSSQDETPGTDLLRPRRNLRLRYVCERSHLPVAHGDLEYNLLGATWLRRHDDPRVQKMAECFLDSYLKKQA